MLILGVFPEWFDARAEDVYAIVLPDLHPRHIVENAVESADVGYVVDKWGE